LIRDIQAKCGRHNWTLLQDGEPAHTARNIINFLLQENEPDNAPDLNLVNYVTWRAVQEKVNLRHKFTSVDELKLALVEEWRNFNFV
jgi:hypothetical protein